MDLAGYFGGDLVPSSKEKPGIEGGFVKTFAAFNQAPRQGLN
jgi:hypothetical protein